MDSAALENKMNEILGNENDQMMASALQNLNSNSAMPQPEVQTVPNHVQPIQADPVSTPVENVSVSPTISPTINPVQQQVVSTPTATAEMPIVSATAPVTTASTTAEAKPQKEKKVHEKKEKYDRNALENELVTKFNEMVPLEKFQTFLKLCNESATSVAKKLGLQPNNRLLLIYTKGRVMKKEDQLNMVYNFFMNHEELKKFPRARELMTKDLFK